MQNKFTPLLHKAIYAQLYQSATAGWLTLLFLCFTQFAAAQTISTVTPTCVNTGQAVTLTVAGANFRTTSNIRAEFYSTPGGVESANAVQILLAGVTSNATSGTNGSIVTISIPANDPVLSQVRTLYIRLANRDGGSPNFNKPTSASAGVLNIAQAPAAPGPITGPATVCPGSTHTYSVAAQPAGVTFNWVLPSGASIASGANTNSITVNFSQNAQTGTIAVSSSNSCNNSGGTTTTGVTVSPVPQAPTASAPPPVCGPASVTLTASGAPAGGSYRWYTVISGGNPIAGATQNQFTTPTINEPRNYYVSVVNATGCESPRTQVTAAVYATPTATVIPQGNQTLCAGNTITLTANPQPPGQNYTYQWYNSSGLMEGKTGQNIIIGEAGNYYVIVKNFDTCTSPPSNSVTITVNPRPSLATTISGDERCGPGIVNLSAQPGAGGSAVRWYDASTGGTMVFQGTNFSPDLTESQIYYVATYNPQTACESVRSQVNATVKPLPVAQIREEVPKCQNPNQNETTDFILRGTATNANFLNWEVVSGTATIEVSPSDPYTPIVRVQGTGTVRVRLTVQSGNGCGTDVAERDLVVNPVPDAVALNAPPVQRCGLGNVTLNVSGAPQGFSYAWFDSPNGGSQVGTGEQINVPLTAIGTQFFYVALLNSSGCSNPSRTAVAATANDPNNPTTATGEVLANGENITGSTSLEVGQPVTFSALSNVVDNNNAASFQWFMDTGNGPELVPGETNLEFNISALPENFQSVMLEITPTNEICYNENPQQLLSGPIQTFPVELIYLNAKLTGTKVELEWATASEQDNAGFEVQVSENGSTYRKLAYIPTKNGNSSIKQVYVYTDLENGKKGTRYYRLKQVDTSGSFEYFGPRVVSIGQSTSRVIAFPNPFKNEITLDIAAEEAGEVIVVITDAVGKQVLTRSIPAKQGYNTELIRLDDNLPTGMYIIRAKVGNATEYIRILKQE
ncbi:Ig-like domain-containing protein [Pontibacter sp. CAU 1760]